MGVGDATFGYLAGATPLMCFLQLPGAWLLERGVSSRKLLLVAGLLTQLLWVPAAALPLLYSAGLVGRHQLLPLFVICVTLSGVAWALAVPAYFSWMSELVPARVNADFWARRQQIYYIASVAAILISGAAADQAGAIKAWSHGEISPLVVYSVIMVAGALCGVAALAVFYWVAPTPAAPKPKPVPTSMPATGTLKAAIKEPEVRSYLWFSVFANLGFGTTGPLIWLLCLESFKWNRTQTGLLLLVFPLIGTAVSARYWGRAVKSFGLKPMMRLASIIQLTPPIAYALATPSSYWLFAIYLVLLSLTSVIYDLYGLHFVTRACPQLPRATVTALYSIVGGLSLALTTWLAGGAAQWLDGWHWTVGNHHFINYDVVFLFSVAPRLVAAFFLAPRLQEPTARSTRVMVRQLGNQMVETWSEHFGRITGFFRQSPAE
jgi:hypothetical protein